MGKSLPNTKSFHLSLTHHSRLVDMLDLNCYEAELQLNTILTNVYANISALNTTTFSLGEDATFSYSDYAVRPPCACSLVRKQKYSILRWGVGPHIFCWCYSGSTG
jgi:hypothetical protein